nr:unnamed protein product [Callosobruchus analis]
MPQTAQPTCSCCKKVGDEGKFVICSICKKQFYYSCVDLSLNDVKAIRNKPTINFTCEVCSEIGSTLADLRALVVSLQEEVTKLKDTKSDPLATQSIDYEDIIQEISDRNSRKGNLILFGVPEDSRLSDNQRKAQDTEQVKNILNVLGDNISSDTVNLVRLGRTVDNSKPRPIKVKLGDENCVHRCIKGVPKLRRHERYSRVTVAFDRTPRQVEHYKKLKQEIDNRSANGETGLKIKYVRGVPKIVQEN